MLRFAPLLACCLLLLAGCGGGDGSADATDASRDARSTSTTDTDSMEDVAADAPSGKLDHEGYQEFLDYVRTDLGTQLAEEASEPDPDAHPLVLVAAQLDPVVEAYRRVEPPAEIRAAHERFIDAQVAYQERLIELSKDPKVDAMEPEELRTMLANLPEVKEMWAAHQQIEDAGFDGDSRDAP